MIVGVERFFKAAIVDRNSSIASAALVSSYHLHPVAKDVIKRWANEAQEAIHSKASGGGGYSSQQGAYQAVQSTSSITQYHALGLLYLIRQGDRMAVTKMIQQLSPKGSTGVLRSPYAICMLIRFATKVMEDDPKQVPHVFPSLNDPLIPPGSYTVSIVRCTSLSTDSSNTRVTWLIMKLPELFVR